MSLLSVDAAHIVLRRGAAAVSLLSTCGLELYETAVHVHPHVSTRHNGSGVKLFEMSGIHFCAFKCYFLSC